MSKHLLHETAEAQRQRGEKKLGCRRCTDGYQITKHGVFDYPQCNAPFTPTPVSEAVEAQGVQLQLEHGISTHAPAHSVTDPHAQPEVVA